MMLRIVAWPIGYIVAGQGRALDLPVDGGGRDHRARRPCLAAGRAASALPARAPPSSASMSGTPSSSTGSRAVSPASAGRGRMSCLCRSSCLRRAWRSACSSCCPTGRRRPAGTVVVVLSGLYSLRMLLKLLAARQASAGALAAAMDLKRRQGRRDPLSVLEAGEIRAPDIVFDRLCKRPGVKSPLSRHAVDDRC